VVFSPWRDDGGRKSPELPAQPASFAAAIVIVVTIGVVPRGLKIKTTNEEPP
jgi:hypothetical protein